MIFWCGGQTNERTKVLVKTFTRSSPSMKFAHLHLKFKLMAETTKNIQDVGELVQGSFTSLQLISYVRLRNLIINIRNSGFLGTFLFKRPTWLGGGTTTALVESYYSMKTHRRAREKIRTRFLYKNIVTIEGKLPLPLQLSKHSNVIAIRSLTSAHHSWAPQIHSITSPPAMIRGWYCQGI